MPESWQEQFKEAVAQYVIDRGRVMQESDDRFAGYYGGPYDFDATDHLRGYGDGTPCAVVSWSDLQEDEWDEFNGTFNDSLHSYGISVKFSCKCGKLKDRRLLEAARFGDVLRHLVGFDPK